jgi:hypothetical protein
LPEWKRRSHRRHRRSRPIFSGRGTRYAQWTVVILAVALLGRLVWQGMYSVLHPARTQVATQSAPVSGDGRALPVDAVPWQRDVLESIEESRAAAQNGNITNANVAADRAASAMVVARLRSQIGTPDFFSVASTALDRVLQTQPGNERLLAHVTDARIELAQLRTWETALPAGSSDAATKSPLNASSDATSYTNYGDNLPAAGGASSADQYQRRQTGPTGSTPPQNSGQGTAGAAPASRDVPGHISIQSPRTLAANQTVTPQMLGGNYLDATLMADSSEILLPPSSRLMTDNVGISNLTISGAAQTLDNMHWSNVTFIGTRLRYEGGSLDLQNVHFIHCTFGFPSDQRGARLANTIALGQSSITFE